MHLVMFDVDGTLVESYDFDSECFRAAIHDATGIDVEPGWDRYRHVTDSGILYELLHEEGLGKRCETATAAIKSRFLARISDYIAQHGVSCVPGAIDFVHSLQARDDVQVAMATGGWLESAKLKLEAAGFTMDGIAIASGSDHCDRVEIMKESERRTGGGRYQSKTYVGDRPWDLWAATALGYSFVAVGDAVEHPVSISNFNRTGDAFSGIGL